MAGAARGGVEGAVGMTSVLRPYLSGVGGGRSFSAVVSVQSEGEFRAIREGAGVSVVDFTATWCGPCKAIAPHYEDMAEDPVFQDVTFAKVDIDDHPSIAESQNVTAVPTFVIFKNNEQVMEIRGADLQGLTQGLADVVSEGREK